MGMADTGGCLLFHVVRQAGYHPLSSACEAFCIALCQQLR